MDATQVVSTIMDLRELDFPIVAIMELTPIIELYGLDIGKVKPNSVLKYLCSQIVGGATIRPQPCGTHPMTETKFLAAAETSFGFLETKGFRIVLRSPTQLLYSSKRVNVSVDWDPRSGELEVFLNPTINHKVAGGAGYSLTDFLAMQKALPEENLPHQVSDENKLEKFLSALAERLENIGAAALEGDPMTFRRLDVFRSENSRALMLKINLNNARTKADAAWNEKNFRAFVSTLEPFENHLLPSEKGRLQYARAKI